VASATRASADVPALPPWKAFMVQFTNETSAGGDFAGRLEHLHSGRRARFKSAAELVATLERLLEQIDEDH
jgi:hypothetical protein